MACELCSCLALGGVSVQQKVPVILMRPGEANNQLASYLEEKLGQETDVWRWPAFTIELPDEEGQRKVASRLANLDDVEMVVLPSPSAVTAVAHWVDHWPSHITLATVGEGTARVIRKAFGPDVKLLSPTGDAENSGSEALWDLVKRTGAPSRVLILRGQTGREWLPTQFRSIGSDVITLCTYVRVPIDLTPKQQRTLQHALEGPHPVVYITSTDAVDAFVHALHQVENAHQWALKGRAITIHPRVVGRLKQAGFRKITVTSTDVESVYENIYHQVAKTRRR